MSNFGHKRPSLQIAITEWIEHKMPETAARLNYRILMPSGYYMTIDEVSMHMASAAMAVLEQACSFAGLDGS